MYEYEYITEKNKVTNNNIQMKINDIDEHQHATETNKD